MSRLVDSYPRAWRARYGDELEDLVAARPLGLGGSIDLLRGAVDAHRHPELVDPAAQVPTGLEPVSRQRFEDLRVARRLGTGSLVGAGLWLIGWAIAANGPIVYDGGGSYRDGAAGLPFVLVATGLLSGGLLGQLIRIPGKRRVARSGAILALVTAPIWGLAPWMLPVGVVTLAGLMVLALAAWWSGEWSAPSSLAILASCIGGVALIWTSIATGDRGMTLDGMMIGIVVFTVNWLIVGATLQPLPEAVDDPGSNRDPETEVATV